jgi:spermidine synthase
MSAAMCVCCIVTAFFFILPGFFTGAAWLKAMDPTVSAVFFCLVVAGGVYFLGGALYPRIRNWFDAIIREAANPLQNWGRHAAPAQACFAIIVLSGAMLFLELVLIRWQGSLFPVFALYKNFTLLACFCGLGIGYALSHQKPQYLPLALPLMASIILMLLSVRYTAAPGAKDVLFYVPVREETSVFNFAPVKPNKVSWIFDNVPVYLLLIVTFVLNVLAMIPIAQFCGHVMTRARTLVAYGCNLLGSIAGVALLFLLSWLWIGPVVWFTIGALPLVWFLLPAGGAGRTAICATLACALLTAWPVDPMVQSIYSPYQLIQKASKADGLMEILSAGSYYQRVYDLSKTNLNRDRGASKEYVGYYELPFQTAPKLGRAVIVGAGSGNDVAAALRVGAKAVDAVEIDPAILALGRANHPEHPYDDARVNAVNNDARTFFRNATDNYDAIVYGVLDSHILLSHGSNVRLDSFVYTQQGLEEAYRRLQPGGLLSLSFALPNERTGVKIYRMLQSLPGAGKPVAVFAGNTLRNITTFIVEKGAPVKLPQKFMEEHDLTETTSVYAGSHAEQLDIPTDDWPFFYMDARMYPASYVVALVLVMALAGLLVRVLLPGQKWDHSLLPFFFLGGGFMLVETKAITELGLLFGNTWHVIGITIIGVLVMAFFANVLVARHEFKKVLLPYGLLLAAVAVGYIVATNGGSSTAGFSAKLGMVALLTSPMLFSGIVFSTLLKRAGDLPSALAYNLMGAMLGGLLEYNSMEFGFAFLYLLAFALYAAAAATTSRKLLGIR